MQTLTQQEIYCVLHIFFELIFGGKQVYQTQFNLVGNTEKWRRSFSYQSRVKYMCHNNHEKTYLPHENIMCQKCEIHMGFSHIGGK
jgi:hypothetical protein